MSFLEDNKKYILYCLINKGNNLKSNAITLLSKAIGRNDFSENTKDAVKLQAINIF